MCPLWSKRTRMYRGMLESKKSGNKTSSGEIVLNIRTLASPKGEQDQVSGGVRVLCCHVAAVAIRIETSTYLYTPF